MENDGRSRELEKRRQVAKERAKKRAIFLREEFTAKAMLLRGIQENEEVRRVGERTVR